MLILNESVGCRLYQYPDENFFNENTKSFSNLRPQRYFSFLRKMKIWSFIYLGWFLNCYKLLPLWRQKMIGLNLKTIFSISSSCWKPTGWNNLRFHCEECTRRRCFTKGLKDFGGWFTSSSKRYRNILKLWWFLRENSGLWQRKSNTHSQCSIKMWRGWPI